MTKKSKSGLRSLSRELISGKHHDDWVREIESGSDRAVAIIAVANLEITIERLILHHLPRGEDEEVAESLRKPEGSLSTFYQKIDIAHAMELITDSRRSCTKSDE